MGHISSHFVDVARSTHDGGDRVAGTRQRDRSSDLGDSGDWRPSFFYFSWVQVCVLDE